MSLEKYYNEGTTDGSDCVEEVRAYYVKRIKELEAKLAAKWISVKERLPEYGKWCFVVGKFGIVQKVAYARDVGEWRPACEDADSVPDSYVTHWQPLPPDPPVQP